MSALFTIPSLPPQLQEAQDSMEQPSLSEGFQALGFRPGTPGFRAIERPVTPVDKAFQIYAIHLAHANHFKTESYDHETMWRHRDAAWKAGAEWLMESQAVYQHLNKKEFKALAKILPEALRCQCSLELPPGSWEDFPRDSKRQTKDMDLAMVQLQHMGLNIKIHGIAILEGDTPSPAWKLPNDQGTLASMVEAVHDNKRARAEREAVATPQNSLF